MSTAQHNVVGKFSYNVGEDGKILYLSDWPQNNLVTIRVPQLNRDVVWYKGAVNQLLGFWYEVEAKGLLDRVLTYDGDWNPRVIRGTKSTPSNHAVGTAFDINAAWNGLGATPAGKGKKGSVLELVPIAEKWGFMWGGDFRYRKDGMHFEVKHLLSKEEVDRLKSAIYIKDKVIKPTPVEPAKLVIAVRNGQEVKPVLLESSQLVEGEFIADASEIATVIFSTSGKVSVRKFLTALNIKPHKEGDHLKDQRRYYLYV